MTEPSGLVGKWLQHIPRSVGLQLAAVYGSIFVVSIALVSCLSIIRVSSLLEDVVDTWGESIAEQLAQSTRDAAMQNDAIALQAHLGRALKTRGIVSAAVYDMQNMLLAEVGTSSGELKGHAGLHSFPAMLTLGDNAVGRVVVVIDAAHAETLQRELYWIMLGGGIAGIVFLLLVSFYFSRKAYALHRQASDDFMRSMPKEILPASLSSDQPVPLLNATLFHGMLSDLGDYIARLQRPSPASLLSAAAELINPADACAYVLFEVRNLDVLQRQVSRERLRVLLNLHQQHIENTCRLYGAQRVPVGGACIKMIFPAKTNESDAAFQAACCAYVLTGLLQDCADPEMGIRLQWAMALDWHVAGSNELLRNAQRSQDEQRSHWLCEQIGAGQFACSAEVAERLGTQDKVMLVETSGTGGRLFYRLGLVQDAHRKMLERQIDQLHDL